MKKKLFICAVNQFVRKIIKKPNEETINIQKSSKSDLYWMPDHL